MEITYFLQILFPVHKSNPAEFIALDDAKRRDIGIYPYGITTEKA
jgi:hypothetical protein